MHTKFAILALLLVACGSTPATVTPASDAAPVVDIVTTPPPSAPAPNAAPEKAITPLTRADHLDLMAVIVAVQRGNVEIAAEEIREKQRIERATGKATSARDATAKRLGEMVSALAKARSLPPACFAGIAAEPARGQCIEAGKLWGVDEAGRVGYLRAPPAPVAP